jgi:hypothetical protein
MTPITTIRPKDNTDLKRDNAAAPGEVVVVFVLDAFFSSMELVFDVDEDEDVDDILIYNDRIFYHKREEIMFC